MSQKHEVTINRDQVFKIPALFIQQAVKFRHMMLRYECAVEEITTKLNILDREMGVFNPRNPIAVIKSRVKKPQSIVDKLIRYNFPVSVESVEENLDDVAGVRVICSYIDDIYTLAKMIAQQDDINVLETKDYISNPKPNGYRSLHMIVAIPVFLSEGKVMCKVEIQIRTIAMDFWASLEHEIRYKKDLGNIEEVSNDLKECAETIAETDKKMLAIRQQIDIETNKSQK
ncbi:GTP pyrophosphokinase family protein [Erysipelothrix sp. HDW6A]|uniref:GTP pyrophosphokinase n=1 Tax=Erysipelothrix sp. HDW6A TaxID=2714928 RepID=UPI001408C618|nr:GTP pyrophosphokinase family protein [Erysipelothrix sp. HDW6A]QIK56701.1 GTP pyrophosphokinase family protein [Erysipelothrix sp. HDW6A]